MITTIIIVLLIVYLARRFWSDMEVTNPVDTDTKEEAVVGGKFTPNTLAKYNGTDDPRIYIAVKGTVFDVSQGAGFYGPGGPYANFAGRDASRGLALNSFDPAVLTPLNEPIDLLEGLSSSEIESLDGWEEHFENKYRVVGTLDNEKK